MFVAWVQEELDVADEAELKELLAVARSQLPAKLTADDAPPLGYVFDAVPVATEARGEKRKRIMIDNLEMEGNIGGHVNVMRNVSAASVTLAPTCYTWHWACLHALACVLWQSPLQLLLPELELSAEAGQAQLLMLELVRQDLP